MNEPANLSASQTARISAAKAVPGRPCRYCGEWLSGWRQRADCRWEPLGIDGLLHACPPKARRNWWARQHRRALAAQRSAVAARIPMAEARRAP